MKGRRLRPDESALANMGLSPSDDVYQGPDGQHYQTTPESREDPHLAMLRAAHLAAEPPQGSATEMGRRASEKALPQAMAMMAQGARVEAKPPAANDNRAAANDNQPPAPKPSSDSVAASNTAPAVPAVTPPKPVAPQPMTVAEHAAYGRSGHMTPEERQAASDDVRLIYAGATAGYGDNAIAALKALGAYADGKEFGANYDAALTVEQRKTEEARSREKIAGALIESLPSFIPGYGDATGLIADLKMYREHPEERTWKNAGMTALGILPFIPSAAGMVRRVDKALEAAEDGAKAAVKEGDLLADSVKAVEEPKTAAAISKDKSVNSTMAPDASFSRNYPKTFFTAHPELKGKVTVHRAIEFQVLNNYPGLFTEAEIFGLDNLRGIPNEMNSTLHLREIRMEWNQFYRQYQNPTKEQFLEKVADIDRKLGHHFTPPRGDNR